ncbi:MAG: virulence factor BrkB family protein [Enterobacteriaceae bacterium]
MSKLSACLIRHRVLKPLVNYTHLLVTRIQQDRLPVLAGHLAYVSLLSLVPLITVVFSLLTAFPVFNEISLQLKTFIYHNFIPAAGETVQTYLDQFVANSSKMTAIGICGLIVTSLLLISSIDGALNHIWRSQSKRSLVFSFAVYWMILTLGPILAGASMVISTYILSMGWLHDTPLSQHLDKLLRSLPFLLSFAVFWLVYNLVPTVRVRLRDAALGALVAALFFELGKKLFGLYVQAFPTYQLIYGVLAVIPILFVWIYVSWCIVLFGAEITATLGEYWRLPAGKKPSQEVKEAIE